MAMTGLAASTTAQKENVFILRRVFNNRFVRTDSQKDWRRRRKAGKRVAGKDVLEKTGSEMFLYIDEEPSTKRRIGFSFEGVHRT